MKKIVVIFAALLLVCVAFVSNTQGVAYAATATTDIAIDSNHAWQVLSDFVSNHPDREYNTAGELNAGYYIRDYFTNIGFENVTAQKLYDEVNSYNYIAKIDVASTDKKIVIGAHYDSADGEGATDNGSGVAAMLLIAEQLFANKDKLTVDVEFVAFAGEEVGLFGSYAYCNALSPSAKNDILLMVNIDSIASGDNLYIHGEDKRTAFTDLFLNSAEGSAFALQQKPLYKDIYYGIDNWGYGYYQTAQNSDHTPFRVSGIPTLLYFSGSYSTLMGNYVESTVASNCVMNTAKDTLQHLQTLGQDIVTAKLTTVAESVINAVFADNFLDVATNARNELVSNAWRNIIYPMIAVAVILVILLILTFVYYRKLDKQSIMGNSEARGTAQKVFGHPKAEDIFDLDEKK